MLSTPVFVFNPSSLGGGQYQFELYFQNPAKAVFLNLGDYIEDTANNRYQIIAPTTIPNTDGAVVRAQFVTSNVLPVEDTDYDSLAYTPNQADLRPEMQTTGSLGSASLHSGPNYEYSLLTGWNSPADAAKAVVGDRIVDFNGKEFEITFIDNINRFDVNIRIKEVEKVGVFPAVGDATLFRPTPSYKFFQGTQLPGSANLKIAARDAQLIDRNLASAGGDWVVVIHTITNGELLAKQFSFTPTPLVPSEVKVEIHGVPVGLQFGADYNIAGAVFSWNGLGLDGLLQENDVIELFYFS